MSNGYQIDFLNFTLPSGHVPRALKMLHQFELTPHETGLYGYKYSFTAPGCKLLYTPDRKDVHIQLSGRGCDIFDCYSLPDDVRVTRLDIAFDSYDGAYTVEDVWGCLLSRKWAGLARTNTGFLGFGGNASGRTIYIGSAKSECRLRIYDKAAEQKINASERLDYSDWTRYELQLRGKLATATYIRIMEMQNLLESEFLSAVFSSILRPMFFITEEIQIESSKQQNRHYNRVPCPKWIGMFNNYNVDRPRPAHRSQSLNSLSRYVLGSVSSFKVLCFAIPGFENIYFEKLQDSEFKEQHKDLLLDFAPMHFDDEDHAAEYYGHPF